MYIPLANTQKFVTIQALLNVNKHNVSLLSVELKCNRATIQSIIDSDRPHAVVINDDGSLTLLK